MCLLARFLAYNFEHFPGFGTTTLSRYFSRYYSAPAHAAAPQAARLAFPFPPPRRFAWAGLLNLDDVLADEELVDRLIDVLEYLRLALAVFVNLANRQHTGLGPFMRPDDPAPELFADVLGEVGLP